MSRAVLFDLDGVLIDSWHVAESAFLSAAATSALDGPAHIAAFRERLGMPLDEICRDLGLPDGFGCLFLSAARSLDHQAVPFAGVAAMLGSLKADGWMVGIVTGKDSPRARNILASTGLESVVDALVCGDTAPRGKPHPDPLWLCEKWLGAGAALGYVGDTAIDAEAAERAGRPFFHAVWDTLACRSLARTSVAPAQAVGEDRSGAETPDGRHGLAFPGVQVASPSELLLRLESSVRALQNG